MKFGGTSMAGTERIRRVANIVRKQQARGHEVAVVVSAMAGETDRLVNFCREANALYDPAEYDVVVASGEQVTSGLLALTLQSLGCQARSWLGWQLPINTIEALSGIGIDAERHRQHAAKIAVIPGKACRTRWLTTRGRGGSDTSAVAVGRDRPDPATSPMSMESTTDPRIVAKRQAKAVTYKISARGVGARPNALGGLAMKEGVRVQSSPASSARMRSPDEQRHDDRVGRRNDELVEKGDMEHRRDRHRAERR